MAKAKSPAFQFYPGDWLSSARIMLMSPAEEGAYIRLLSISWEQGLPDSDEELSALSRLGDEWHSGSGKKIRACFTVKKAGRLFNRRLLSEKKKQEKFSKGKSDAGKKGAKSRWKKEKGDDGTAIGLPLAKNDSSSLSLSLSSSSSSDKNKNKTKTSRDKPRDVSPTIYTGENFVVTKTIHDALGKVYDLKMCREEYPKADLWITAHPRKKRKKWLAFLMNWMEIAVKKQKEHGSDNFRPQGRKKKAEPKICQGCDEEVSNLYPGGVCARCYSTDPSERRGDI